MIRCQSLIKELGNPPQVILSDLNLQIDDGEFVSISGRSGSGKSTLLYILSTLDLPSGGRVLFDDKDISTFSVEEIHRFRNVNIGFIFQFHYLLPELTALENVLLPIRNLGATDKYQDRAQELLARLGLEKHSHKYPGQLSGGEQQRVAIARALILNPKYIFADEPTGNLDTFNAELVMSILKEVNQKFGTTVCLVTHDPDFARMANRQIFLKDGRMAVSGHDS